MIYLKTIKASVGGNDCVVGVTGFSPSEGTFDWELLDEEGNRDESLDDLLTLEDARLINQELMKCQKNT